jgi:hypothetical protein
VARFDPSKGLNDLLAGYLQFRQKVEEAGRGGDDGDAKKPPQLIVVGHGSIDDPDGTRIYEELHQASPGSCRPGGRRCNAQLWFLWGSSAGY